MGQVYCTVQELLNDLEHEGLRNHGAQRVYDMILSASQWILNRFGNFIPRRETKYFDGESSQELLVPALLSVSEILVGDDELASGDYILYPQNKLWVNGPYMRIKVHPDSDTVFYFPRIARSVSISGTWGLWEKSQSTGATVASQTESATTLVVDDASSISPGAILLIESEQELVTGIGAATDSATNTNEALDAEDNQVTVLDGTKVEIGEVIRVEFEQMLVRDISGNDLLVERGWNRTARVAHLTNLDVYVYRTFNVERGVNGTSAAAHTSKAVSRYTVPADVNYLCKQIAALMLKKADSGFAGKVGSVETGETFYFNEFPKAVIEQIQENYFIPLL